MSTIIGSFVKYNRTGFVAPIVDMTPRDLDQYKGGKVAYLNAHPELTGGAKFSPDNDYYIRVYELHGIYENCVYVNYLAEIRHDFTAARKVKLSVSRKPATYYALQTTYGSYRTDCWMECIGCKTIAQYQHRLKADLANYPLQDNVPRLMESVKSKDNGTIRLALAGLVQVDPAKNIRKQAEVAVNDKLLQLLQSVKVLAAKTECTLRQAMES